jgi:4-diphosphocytidyl-2-C-methyl-D-erythritol kinase
MIISVFAPAKVNLALAVGRPFANGRHPLSSLVVFADVGDHLLIEPHRTLTLELDGAFAETLLGEADNLVMRAAERLLAETADAGPRPGARLVLQKELPIASGIGGGSADAAAALRGLAAYWGLEGDDRLLQRIARGLGADVPACLQSQPVLMAGGGEDVTRIDVPELAAVLINAGRPVSTSAVYRAFDAQDLGGDFAPYDPPTWADAATAIAGLSLLQNDLESPAIALEPQIAQVLEYLRGIPEVRLARLSGSGGTVFALVDDMETAFALEDLLDEEQPEWWTRAARLGGVDVSSVIR